MYKATKEISTKYKIALFFDIKEVYAGVMMFGLYSYTTPYIHKTLHIFYFIYLLLVYVLFCIPKSQGQKIYHGYIAWLIRLKGKITEYDKD